jgi:predicted dehydrogenase
VRGLLVGYGSIGRRHLENLRSMGVNDWAIVHTGTGTLPLEPATGVRTYVDISEALAHEKPDFAVVANPTSLHVPTAVQCAQAGCDMLLEKPVSHSLEGLGELTAAATANNVKTLVGFQFRFHPSLRRIEQLLLDQTIGPALHARVVWGEYLPGWHPWEDWRIGYAARADLGGGVHHTICHPLDYLLMLLGEPTGVAATLSKNGLLELDVAESADVHLSFSEGCTVQLHLDYWARPAVHRVEIVCAGGTIVWDYLGGEFRVWDAGAGVWCEEESPGVSDRNALFEAEAQHFLNVVAGEAEPVCTLDDGIAVVRLCAEIERVAGLT